MANSNFPAYFGIRNGFGRQLIDLLREERIHTLIPAWPWYWDTGVLAIDPAPGEYQISVDASGATATTLNTLLADVGPFPSNVHVLGAQLELLKVFAGGSVSAATVEAGDSGDPNGYLTATDVFTGATTGLVGALGAQLDNENYVFESALEPSITLRTTSDDTDALTTGKLRYRILFIPTGELGS